MPQNENTENKNQQKIVQTAGRAALGDFAPDFAHFNDDILFGESGHRPKDALHYYRCLAHVAGNHRQLAQISA